MIVEAFPKLENTAFVRALRTYFRSVWNVIVIAALMTVSALFGLEIPVYYCFAVIALAVCFFGEDMLGAVPLVCYAPMTIAIKNNPEHYPDTTILSDSASLIQMGFVVAVVAVLLIGRIVSMLIFRSKRGMPRLTAGFAALAVSFLLGGALSEYYSADAALFGLMEIASIALLYFVFYFTVNWETVPKGHVAKVFAVLGFVLVVQILSMYFREGVVVNGGIENREKLFLGWGHYNYAGAVTAMCIPAIFYFSITQKHGWIFTMLATVVMLGVALSQSRGSMLFGGFIYLVCAVITLVKTKKKERIFHIVVFAVVLIAGTVCCIVWLEKLKNVFAGVFKAGFSDNNRILIFREAWAYFLGNPVFGVGWMGDPEAKGFFYPGFFMAHNTVMQLLGSLGLVGFLAYAFHRVQTCIVLFRCPTTEKVCIALSIAVLLLTCMMDVHIFSFGPAMLYSTLLVFLEGVNKKNGVDSRLRLRKKRIDN